jgi:hypothetical protein
MASAPGFVSTMISMAPQVRIGMAVGMGAVAEFVLYSGEVSHGLLPPVAFHLVGQGSFGHR